MREWQQTKFKELVLPDTVYYESLWAVRDLHRMEEQLDVLNDDINSGDIHTTSLVSDINVDYDMVKPTEDVALKKANLERRIKAINDALDSVPIAYRQFIMDNIVLQKGYSCFPNKFWRIWKQKFLYNVAKNLLLI